MSATKDIMTREPSLEECARFAPVVAQIAQQGAFAALEVDLAKAHAALLAWQDYPGRFVRVAEIDGELVGAMIGYVARQWFSQDLTGHDTLLFVAPEYRGQGIARELIEDFEVWCVARGAKLIFMSNSLGGVDKCSPGFGKAGSVYVRQVTHV